MDYLTYAYLQRGRDADAERVVADLSDDGRTSPPAKFKIGYAANAMPVRLAIERRKWDDSRGARAAARFRAARRRDRLLGTRGRRSRAADIPMRPKRTSRRSTRASTALAPPATMYWATQTEVLADSARAWQSLANGNTTRRSRSSAQRCRQRRRHRETPVTPGPIVPAREQLGDLLLEAIVRPMRCANSGSALDAAPGRRGALIGAAQAAERAATRKQPQDFVHV